MPVLKQPKNGKQIKTHDSIKIEGDQSWVIDQLTNEQQSLDKLGMPDVLKILKRGLLKKLQPSALKKTSTLPAQKLNKSLIVAGAENSRMSIDAP